MNGENTVVKHISVRGVKGGSALKNDLAELEKRVKSCPVCGSELITIRGRHPHMPSRIVCATCLQERMDNTKDRPKIRREPDTENQLMRRIKEQETEIETLRKQISKLEAELSVYGFIIDECQISDKTIEKILVDVLKKHELTPTLAPLPEGGNDGAV
jgi:predicted RNase H-like nuclease (RuvC/YqgF family)